MKTLVAILAFFTYHTGVDLDRREVLCMAMNVYHEARGEPLRGQLAVAQVTLKRAARHGSVCKAVYARSQFSWTKGNPPITEKKAWAESVRVAALVMTGIYERGFANGATHYFAPKDANPSWGQQFETVAKIGGHVFLIESE